MEWTEDDAKFLRDFRNIQDCDDIKLKQEIKTRLLDNKYIVHVLHNQDLDGEDPEEYFGINIRPYYMIPETQHNVKNFLCFETSYNEIGRYNGAIKTQQIIFYILCHEADCIDNETSVARHDLLAALVMDEFNYAILSCGRIKLVEDKPSVTDNKYLTRTLIFETVTDNNLVKTKNGQTSFANKSVADIKF